MNRLHGFSWKNSWTENRPRKRLFIGVSTLQKNKIVPERHGMENIMKLIDNNTVKANNNKGYTMRKIIAIVKDLLVNADTFDKFLDAFYSLDYDLENTDFLVFFGTGDDFGYNENNGLKWYFNVTNTVKGNKKTFDITEEIDAFND
jgi:hypothetical protein